MAYPSKGSKREKVRKFIKKEFLDKNIPLDTINKKSVARTLMQRMPGLWSSLDAARRAVRDVMGCGGEEVRRKISDPNKLIFYGRKKLSPTISRGAL